MSDEPEEVFSNEDPSDLFELEEELAVGSFGAVYRGVYLPENEIVAVKVMQPEDEEAYQDIVVEILIMKELSHPNIIKFYGAYKKDDELLIAMELAAGGAVDTLMEVLGPLDEKVISFITRESLKSLHYLHEKCCIIHRDIKAANILLTEDGEVKLADFGVSARLKSKLQRRRTFTGTPWWMAPEIIPCSRDPKCSYDYRVDIWAIGITCLEMAEATAPMFEIEPMDVLPEIAKRPPPELRNPSEWTPEFVEFLSWCLKKNPNERKTTKALLDHPFLVNCQGSKADVKVLLQELSKKTRAFQEQQEEEEEEKKTEEMKSPRTDTKKKKKDESSPSAGSPPAAGNVPPKNPQDTPGAGFAPKSLSNTARLRPYQPKTEKERQTQGMMLLQQRLMHQQLRALKKHQGYCNKQIEELQKRQATEMAKMDKKYQEKIQQLEKTKRKTAEKTAKQEEKEKEAIDKKFAASEGKSLKGVMRSGMRSLGLRSANSPEIRPNESTQSPRPVEPFKRSSSDADGQLQLEMDSRVTNLAEIISLRTKQLQSTFSEQIKVVEQQHALEVELCHFKGKTDTHHIEQYTQLLKEQLVTQHKIEADKGIVQREKQVMKDQKERKKRFIMQKRKEGVAMDRITQMIQVQDQTALQKLAQDNLKREIHIKIRQKEETFDYEEKIMKELHKTQNDHFYADCRLRLQHKQQMGLLYEEQANTIRAFAHEIDALLTSLKKQQEEEKTRDGHADAKTLQAAHSEQEEYLIAKKEWFKNMLIDENDQRIKESEESRKKIALSNFRLKQAYFFQHTKEQQQQLEKRKKLTSDTEALFDQRKQMLILHHEKNLALLRHQAKTLTFLIEEPALVEKMERDLNEAHQREIDQLQEALEKEKQRLEKEYESRFALMMEQQKQGKEELMKEEEEAIAGGPSSAGLSSSSSSHGGSASSIHSD